MGGKHDRVLERLRSQADDIRRLCGGMDEAAISRRAKPDQWSLKEVLAHVGRIQDVFERRLEALLTEARPAITSYSPEADPEFESIAKRSSAELLKSFEEKRRRIVARLESLSPEDWHRAGRHSDYPSYDVHLCMEYMGHHEAHHIYQMFERRAVMGVPAAH